MGKQELERQRKIGWNKIIAFVIVLVVALGAFCYLYFQTGILKKLFKETYTITFVVEGVSYEQKAIYGEEPVFRGSLYKPGTETIEYFFTHWSPSIVEATGNATYVANFAPQTRLYEVNIESNYPKAATITGGGRIYEYKDDAMLTVSVNAGYVFEGWYREGSFVTSATILTFNDIVSNINLTAKFSLITKNIVYNDMLNGSHTNQTVYDVEDGEFTLKKASKNGYTFLGWYDSEVGGNKVDKIISSALVDVTLYARWEIIVYTITYDLKGGTNSPLNVGEYTVESGNITIYPATKEDCEFMGWTGAGLDGYTKEFIIPAGSYGNKQYAANFDGEEMVLTLNVDGKVLDEFIFYSGSILSQPSLDSSEYGMNGYEINSWYTDSGLTNKYTFTEKQRAPLTLYAKWQWQFDEGFMPYINKFSTITSDFVINSYDELVCWAEFVKFYDLTNTKTFTLSYCSLTDYALLDEIGNAVKDATFTGSTVSYTAGGNIGKIYVKSSTRSSEATLDADPSKSWTYVQQDYAFSQMQPNTRADGFDSFNINNVKTTINNVETTNQLVYAFEKGARPICKTGSSAENVYNKAKAVLRDIVSDNMSELAKLRAIYEWLILNVEYDNVAAANINNPSFDWKKYDSWYAEGVFNKGKAVCDGLAKAFVILCGIENIPCLRIEGSMHAWNKVFIDGAWYGVDSTHGGVIFEADGSEVLTYNQFMFTDTFKVSQGYIADNYTEYVANTEFDYYDYYSISQSVDLLINSAAELTNVLKSVKTYTPKISSDYFTVEIAFDESLESSISQVLMQAKAGSGVSFSKYSDVGRNTAGNKVYILFIG